MKCIVLSSGQRANKDNPGTMIPFCHLMFMRLDKEHPETGAMVPAVQCLTGTKFAPGSIIDLQCDLYGQIVSCNVIGKSDAFEMLFSEF